MKAVSFVVSARTNLKVLNEALVITIENTQWRHVTKRSAQFVHQEVQQRIIICMSCGFCIIKMLKFYATAVSLIKFIFYINNVTLMQAWKFCKISRNTFSTEHLRTTASWLKILQLKFRMIAPFTFLDVRTLVIWNACLQECKRIR